MREDRRQPMRVESFLRECPRGIKPTQRTREEKQLIEDRIEVYAARARMRLPLFPKEECHGKIW